MFVLTSRSMVRVVAVSLALLIGLYPPEVRAAVYSIGDIGPLPSYRVTLGTLGVSWDVEEVEGGYRVSNVSNPSESVIIGREDIDVSTINLLTLVGETAGATISVPGGATGVTFGINGNWDPSTEDFNGVLYTAAGATISSIAIEATGASGGQQTHEVVIIVVLSAAAIVGLSCAIIQLLTDCGQECKESCGEGNVEKYKEKFCGRCECTCKH